MTFKMNNGVHVLKNLSGIIAVVHSKRTWWNVFSQWCSIQDKMCVFCQFTCKSGSKERVILLEVVKNVSLVVCSGYQQFTWNSILFHLVQPCQDRLDDISSVSTLAGYWQVLFNPTIWLEILLRAFIVEFLWACLSACVYIVKSIHFKNTSIQISLQWNWCLAPLKHLINYLGKTV